MYSKFGLAIFAVITSIGLAFGYYTLQQQKPAVTVKATTGYFYRYTLDTYAEEDVKDINNYVRSELSCDPGEHVCGVTLATDTGTGQQPNSTEFDAVKDDLWDSEFTGIAQLPDISMRE